MLTLLIVDNNSNDLKVIQQWISQTEIDCRTIVANNAFEALDMLRGKYPKYPQGLKPDLAVIDIQTPLVSGLSLLNTLKSLKLLESIELSEGQESLPVIMYSDAHNDRDMQNSHSLGAFDFVSTSPNAQDLLTSLDRLIAKLNDQINEKTSISRLLIVDDDYIVRRSIKMGLAQKGCEVFETDSGRNIVSLIKTHDIQLVLLDVMMDEVDGIQTLQKIKQSYPQIPVVMISSDRFYLEMSLDLGADNMIEKPVHLDQLSQLIHNYGV